MSYVQISNRPATQRSLVSPDDSTESIILPQAFRRNIPISREQQQKPRVSLPLGLLRFLKYFSLQINSQNAHSLKHSPSPPLLLLLFAYLTSPATASVTCLTVGSTATVSWTNSAGVSCTWKGMVGSNYGTDSNGEQDHFSLPLCLEILLMRLPI